METKKKSNDSENPKQGNGKEKVIAIKIKDINQLKIILATWYSYLLTKNKENLTDFQEAIKTPIIYNIEKDELELLLTGSYEMLQELNHFIQNLNKEFKKKK
jgi:glycerol kinase